ncbi:glycosyltransferase [Azospirillum sp. YIM B02556]|uniref:Glycosyltransferase n=1 Tax=Azospirillum endophyticum TaxID=2800326 RepID=A0ABS1F126_9PROT|nr:glycosyltransferase [Azospirillum endophyticum]MBK1837115.1 glycosyltransferase [Azospirillum endophyticum]
MPQTVPSDRVTAAAAALSTYLVDRQFGAEKINRFAALCEETRRALDLDSRLLLAEMLERTAESNDTIRLRSVLFLLTGDLYHYERILHYLILGGDSADPAALHYTHWCMSRQLFLGAASGDKLASFVPCDLFRSYTAMVRQIARRWDLTPPRAALRDGPIRRVAMVTNQFTNQGHQPTRDCFDFAARMQDEFGLDVAIINVNGLPSRVENVFIPPMVAEVAADLEGVFALKMFGRQVKVASFTEPVFGRDKLSVIVEAIDGYDPDLIVSFGGSNIVSDLFGDSGARPVVALPTSSGITLSLAPIVLGFEERDHTQSIPTLYRTPFARRFRPFTFGYTLPPSSGVRVDTGFPDGTVLFAVVGTRLDQEVTGEVLSLLDDILDRCPAAGLVFAGDVRELPAQLAPLRNAARMRCLGHVADIRALYARCHVFLNPPRQGGGGGAAFALAEEVPVVTHGWGDGASVSGPEFCVGDRAAYLDRAVTLATDSAARTVAGTAAKARFAAIGDRNRCVERLLAYGEEARSLLRAERAGAN